MNEPVGLIVTSVAESAIGKILKMLARGAIKHLGRDAVEAIVRDVLTREWQPQFTYGPITTINVAVDEVYAILGNDNRFEITTEYNVALTSNQSGQMDNRARLQLARAEVDELRTRLAEKRGVSGKKD